MHAMQLWEKQNWFGNIFYVPLFPGSSWLQQPYDMLLGDSIMALFIMMILDTLKNDSWISNKKEKEKKSEIFPYKQPDKNAMTYILLYKTIKNKASTRKLHISNNILT